MQETYMLLGLGTPAACDRSRTGSKAAALATLLQAGFSVADGTVQTTDAFAAFAAAGADSGAAPMPGTVRAALGQLAGRYGGTPVAIRSSALAEDLPDATFAGQYETVLNVRGAAAIEDAVRRCWMSLASPAASTYRLHADAASGQAMAVLVQPM